jgi:short subunit dehydrogenase-like uncharacterized protein
MMADRRETRGKGQAVAVFGAAGHTGRFVIAELQRRGFAPIAIGRCGTKLASAGFEARGVPVRTASIEDPLSLDLCLAGASAVINCAGPFLDTADAVAAAALRTRIHYCDVTAEQASAQATFVRFGAAAREAGIVVVPAMGFYGGFGDLLVTAAMGDRDAADDIAIHIALDSWLPTQGTRNTGRRNTAQRLVIANGKLEPHAGTVGPTLWDFPAPFGLQEVTEVPLSEVVLIARHLKASALNTYIASAALGDLQNPDTPPPAPADESGRSAQIFLVQAIVRKGSETRCATARGRDIYAFTAPLVVEAVQHGLEGRIPARGAFAPGEIFDAKDFLESLVPEHLTFEISETR